MPSQPTRRRGGRVAPTTADPCRICGTPQATHWRCARCGARGHLIPRSTTQPTLCSWCVRDDARPGWHTNDEEYTRQ